MDEFEQFLRDQPVRGVPAAWRREVLPAEDSARWRGWLWPSPVAWAAVAAAWLVVAGLQFAARPGPNGHRPAATPAALLAQQHRLFNELMRGES
jgi:hypothetical protein